jgi:hypothetical protein
MNPSEPAMPAPAPAPRLLIQPASEGLRWVRQSWAAFASQPFRFGLQFFIFMAGMSVLAGFGAVLPGLGTFLVLATLPWVTLVFMLAASGSRAGRFSISGSWLAPWQGGPQRTRALLMLCLLYAAASMAIIALSNWADGGRLLALEEALLKQGSPAGPKGEPGGMPEEQLAAMLADPGLLGGLMLRALLATLLSIPFWHAPALTHWCAQPAAKAMFFSTLACWRNKGAFAVYGLVWLAIAMAGAILLNVLAVLGVPALAAALTSAMVLFLCTAMYVSFFFTFAGCFEPARAESTPTEPTADADDAPGAA